MQLYLGSVGFYLLNLATLPPEFIPSARARPGRAGWPRSCLDMAPACPVTGPVGSRDSCPSLGGPHLQPQLPRGHLPPTWHAQSSRQAVRKAPVPLKSMRDPGRGEQSHRCRDSSIRDREAETQRGRGRVREQKETVKTAKTETDSELPVQAAQCRGWRSGEPTRVPSEWLRAEAPFGARALGPGWAGFGTQPGVSGAGYQGWGSSGPLCPLSPRPASQGPNTGTFTASQKGLLGSQSGV